MVSLSLPVVSVAYLELVFGDFLVFFLEAIVMCNSVVVQTNSQSYYPHF